MNSKYRFLLFYSHMDTGFYENAYEWFCSFDEMKKWIKEVAKYTEKFEIVEAIEIIESKKIKL